MKTKAFLLSLCCLLLLGSLMAADNRFLNRIVHYRNHPSFAIDSYGDKIVSRNQNQVWIYSTFNPWQPQVDASYYSVFPIEDVDLMADRYLFLSSREPANTILEVDSLNIYGKIFFPTTLEGDRIQREGSILYLSDWQRGIEIIDIGAGGNRETKSVFSEKWGIKDFVSQYPYLYALNDFGVVTIDVSQHSFPQSIGRNYELSNATIIRKNHNILWIAAGKNLYGVSVHDLNNPTLISQYRFTYDVMDLEIKDNRLFAALGSGGVRILEISNPARPTDLNWINLPTAALDLALEKEFIYISSGASGWYVYSYR